MTELVDALAAALEGVTELEREIERRLSSDETAELEELLEALRAAVIRAGNDATRRPIA